MRTIRILSLVMLLIASQRAFAYERARFTLEEAIRYAMKNHPKVLVAENRVTKQREILKSVKMFDPQVSFHGGYDMMRDREYYGISVSQSLDSIFDYKRNLEKAKLDLNSTAYEAELVRQEVVGNVREAYAEYFSKLNELRLCLKKLSLERKSFRLAAFQFEEGKVPLEGYLSRQKSLEEAGHHVKAAKIAYDRVQDKLYQTIGYRQ